MGADITDVPFTHANDFFDRYFKGFLEKESFSEEKQKSYALSSLQVYRKRGKVWRQWLPRNNEVRLAGEDKEGARHEVDRHLVQQQRQGAQRTATVITFKNLNLPLSLEIQSHVYFAGLQNWFV